MPTMPATQPQPSVWQRALAAVNRGRVAGRQRLYDLIELHNGTNQPLATQQGLHQEASRALTHHLGQVFPPQVSANLADLAGIGNEAISGGIQVAGGHPWESETGFDPADIAENRVGQDKGMKELQANPPLLARAIGDATGWTLGDMALRHGERLLSGYLQGK